MRRTIAAAILLVIMASGCVTDGTTTTTTTTVATGVVSLKSNQYLTLGYNAADKIMAEASAPLYGAAEELYKTATKKLVVSDAGRSVREQATLFYDNCLANSAKSCPSVPTCNPAKDEGLVSGNSAGYALTGTLKNETNRTKIIDTLTEKGKVERCPHTSLIAVDAWCDGGGNWEHDPVCQETLTRTMAKHGFCRIAAEAWHFELNSRHLTTSCSLSADAKYTLSNGTTYNPKIDAKTGRDCLMWNYNKHFCTKVKPLAKNTVSVTIEGSGSVSSSDNAIACPPTCSAVMQSEFPFITATPDAGWYFWEWTGTSCFVENCPLTPSEFQNGLEVTAVFEKE